MNARLSGVRNGGRMRGWRTHRLLLMLSLSSGCFGHHAEEAPVPLRSPVRDSLLAIDAMRGELATRQGLTAAATGWLDSAVVYLRAGAPILYSRAAALSVLGDAPAERSTYQWRPLGGGVSRDGRGGHPFGIVTTA